MTSAPGQRESPQGAGRWPRRPSGPDWPRCKSGAWGGCVLAPGGTWQPRAPCLGGFGSEVPGAPPSHRDPRLSPQTLHPGACGLGKRYTEGSRRRAACPGARPPGGPSPFCFLDASARPVLRVMASGDGGESRADQVPAPGRGLSGAGAGAGAGAVAGVSARARGPLAFPPPPLRPALTHVRTRTPWGPGNVPTHARSHRA